MSEDPESFKIGNGNRKVQSNYEDQTSKKYTPLNPSNYLAEDKFETMSMVSCVSNNPIPYGEESIQERINKINALNKKGNYVDQNYYKKQREENSQKNISYSPKNIDKAKNNDDYLQSTLDNYNLMQEKLNLEKQLEKIERLDCK